MMGQVINTNIMSINAARNLNRSGADMATALERLSSGLRINRAKDDAAGLAVAAGFETTARAAKMEIRNLNDGLSLAQAGEAQLAEIQNMAQRILELQAQKSGALGGDANIDAEITELVAEINAQNTTTLGQDLFGSSVSVGGVTIGGNDITTATATNASTVLSDAITARADFGAASNRLEAQIRSKEAVYESSMAAKSRIMDADFATETAALTRAQILQQAGAAMLAQANALPQNTLALLR